MWYTADCVQYSIQSIAIVPDAQPAGLSQDDPGLYSMLFFVIPSHGYAWHHMHGNEELRSCAERDGHPSSFIGCLCTTQIAHEIALK